MDILHSIVNEQILEIFVFHFKNLNQIEHHIVFPLFKKT